MKTSLSLIFFFLAITAHSQIRDTTVSETSNPINLSYSPNSLFSDIRLKTIKFKDGEPGITIIFRTKKIANPPDVKFDSIKLILLNMESLMVDKPYYDSSYYEIDGILFSSITFYLDKNDITVLKKQKIDVLELVVDGRPLQLVVKDKSRKAMFEAFNKFY